MTKNVSAKSVLAKAVLPVTVVCLFLALVAMPGRAMAADGASTVEAQGAYADNMTVNYEGEVGDLWKVNVDYVVDREDIQSGAWEDVVWESTDELVVKIYDVSVEKKSGTDCVAIARLSCPTPGTATLTCRERNGAQKVLCTYNFTITSDKTIIPVPKAKTGLVYNGKEQVGVPAGTGYSASMYFATNAGTYTALLEADDTHRFPGGEHTVRVEWSIAKAPQTIFAKNATVTVKAKKSGKTKALPKDVAVDLASMAKVSAKTKVKYKKSNNAGGKKIAVNPNTGKVTLKKGLVVGIYNVRVKLAAPASVNYKPAKSKTITLTVKVK